MAYDIVITPDPEQGPTTSPVWEFPPKPYHQLSELIRERRIEYPLLYLMTRDIYGPEADFTIRSEQISNLLQELDRILEVVEKLDEPWATAERPGTYTELRGAIWWLKGIVENCRKWGFVIVGYGD